MNDRKEKGPKGVTANQPRPVSRPVVETGEDLMSPVDTARSQVLTEQTQQSGVIVATISYPEQKPVEQGETMFVLQAHSPSRSADSPSDNECLRIACPPPLKRQYDASPRIGQNFLESMWPPETPRTCSSTGDLSQTGQTGAAGGRREKPPTGKKTTIARKDRTTGKKTDKRADAGQQPNRNRPIETKTEPKKSLLPKQKSVAKESVETRKQKDKQGQTGVGTDKDRQGQTSKDKDKQGQTSKDKDRQGQTSKGKVKQDQRSRRDGKVSAKRNEDVNKKPDLKMRPAVLKGVQDTSKEEKKRDGTKRKGKTGQNLPKTPSTGKESSGPNCEELSKQSALTDETDESTTTTTKSSGKSRSKKTWTSGVVKAGGKNKGKAKSEGSKKTAVTKVQKQDNAKRKGRNPTNNTTNPNQ